jgi:hypothetical protein
VRLQEIARTQLLPAVAIDIVVDEEPEAEVEHQTGIAIADGDDGVPAVQIPGAPPSVGGAFLFVQESELEGAEEPEPVVAVVETIEVTDDGTVVVEALDVLDEPQVSLENCASPFALKGRRARSTGRTRASAASRRSPQSRRRSVRPTPRRHPTAAGRTTA